MSVFGWDRLASGKDKEKFTMNIDEYNFCLLMKTYWIIFHVEWKHILLKIYNKSKTQHFWRQKKIKSKQIQKVSFEIIQINVNEIVHCYFNPLMTSLKSDNENENLVVIMCF